MAGALGVGLPLYFSVSQAVMANDSTAVLGAGGLELTVSKDIAMESEDLFLSPREIRVSYLFRNTSDQDIRTRVAFPMPLVPFGPVDNVALPDRSKENFVDFSVTADGKVIRPELEVRAISAPFDDAADKAGLYPDGSDMTDAVLKAGLPVNANLKTWQKALNALSAGSRKKLTEDGLLYDDGGDGSADSFSPQWSMKETYHWEQDFPTAKPVAVKHRYKPVVGSSFFTGDASDMERIKSEFQKKYCLDRAGLAGLQRLLLKAKKAGDSGADNPYLFAVETEYVLKTGANWKGAIGKFYLTIDKLYPDAIMSTCIDGIKKSGATTFEVRRSAFNPENDIRFVVFRMGGVD